MCFHDCHILVKMKEERDNNKLVRSKGKHKILSMTPTMRTLFIANLALEEDIFETERQVYEQIVQDL
jgi:hypothetical protein